MVNLDDWRERLARCLHAVADRIDPEPASSCSVLGLAKRAEEAARGIEKIREHQRAEAALRYGPAGPAYPAGRANKTG